MKIVLLNPLKIPRYLNLANAIKNLSKKNTWTFYDVEADVLYINFHQPALPADDSELTDDDILIVRCLLIGIVLVLLV